MPDRVFPAARRVLGGVAQGPVVASAEALSFWGGVDPATSRVVDARHPLRGVIVVVARQPLDLAPPAFAVDG